MKPDAMLIQLERALDPCVMKRVLQQALFGTSKPEVEIVSCRVDEARYKPAKLGVISYQLTLRDRATQSVTQQLVSGRLLGARERLPTGTPMAFDPAMRLWLFPADRKLKRLARLFDHDWLARDLPATLAPLGFSRRDRLANLCVNTAHYIPERSCMARCEFDWFSAETQQTSRMALFAKQYIDDGGAIAFSIMSQLRSQWPYGAQALRYDPATQTLWQLELPGQTLTWAGLLAADWRLIIDRIVDCVAGLHQSAIRCDRSFGVAEIGEQLVEAEQLAQALDASVAAQTRSLVRRLMSQLEGLSGSPVSIGPLHRDLKLLNFLLDERDVSVRLIDLDGVELGASVIDLGSLVGNLYLNGLRMGTDPGLTERIVERLISAYTQRVATPMRWAHWHIAAAMIYEVLRRSIRQRNADRLQHARAYLRVSQRYCQSVDAMEAR